MFFQMPPPGAGGDNNNGNNNLPVVPNRPGSVNNSPIRPYRPPSNMPMANNNPPTIGHPGMMTNGRLSIGPPMVNAGPHGLTNSPKILNRIHQPINNGPPSIHVNAPVYKNGPLQQNNEKVLNNNTFSPKSMHAGVGAINGPTKINSPKLTKNDNPPVPPSQNGNTILSNTSSLERDRPPSTGSTSDQMSVNLSATPNNNDNDSILASNNMFNTINGNNNNGYRLLSAQGMETLQVFLREHGNECIKQFVQVFPHLFPYRY